MPVLTIFAGINGAGKTTLYKYERKFVGIDLGERINPDEIHAARVKVWKDYASVVKSGRIAINKIRHCIARKISFNWETTIITGTTLKFLREAKEAGFLIQLNFIGVQDVNLSLERIKQRVAKGGHDIPEEIVRGRFKNQFRHIPEALKYVDNALFLDNSRSMQVVATYLDKEFFVHDSSIPWVKQLNETHHLVHQRLYAHKPKDDSGK